MPCAVNTVRSVLPSGSSSWLAALFRFMRRRPSAAWAACISSWPRTATPRLTCSTTSMRCWTNGASSSSPPPANARSPTARRMRRASCSARRRSMPCGVSPRGRVLRPESVLRPVSRRPPERAAEATVPQPGAARAPQAMRKPGGPQLRMPRRKAPTTWWSAPIPRRWPSGWPTRAICSARRSAWPWATASRPRCSWRRWSMRASNAWISSTSPGSIRCGAASSMSSPTPRANLSAWTSSATRWIRSAGSTFRASSPRRASRRRASCRTSMRARRAGCRWPASRERRRRSGSTMRSMCCSA